MNADTGQPSSKDAAPGGAEPSVIVGIGASAGGIQALRAFFGAVQPDSGMAYVVVVHLDPTRESQVAEIIARGTSIPVIQATESVALEPDHAYVIPPDRDLRVEAGMLRLEERGERGHHAPIDLFFRTLAEACGRAAVGVVLSGTGSDGTMGLRQIREAGGTTIAQAPEDAEYDAMPRSAISTGQVDLVLKAAEIPGRLLRMTRAGVGLRLSVADAEAAGGDEEGEADGEAALRQILGRLRAQTGHDFRHYKRSTLLRRLERRLRFNHLETLEQYRDLLRGDPAESNALFKDLLISVSGFFRDPEVFEVVEREAIPALFEGKGPQDRIRVWVPGCATGEEVYSLAIQVAEHAALLDEPPAIRFFATDIDAGATSVARGGYYPATIAADVPSERLARFFRREGDGFRIVKSLREMVLVAEHDLLRDPPFSDLDMISCRNVLIYLRSEAQTRVLETFHYVLRPHGILLLGTSESVDEGSALFVPMHRKHRVYRRGSDAVAARFPMSAPVGAAADATPDARGAAASRTFSWAAWHHRMLEAYAPPSFVVNEAREIVHLSERAGRYLRLGGGEPTLDVLELVPGALRLELRAALYQAFEKGRPTRRGASVETPDGVRQVDLVVRPVDAQEDGRKFALVLIEERAAGEEEADPGVQPSPSTGADAAAIEEELRRVRAELHETIQERENTIEELQAANEELQSINEEQKATSEELETSREELQSINEELTTINQEHGNTIEQLGHANADLRNLMDATEVGTIFLDRELRVRRFTPAITSVFHLVDTDRGRSLADLAHGLRYADLIQDAKRVLESLERVEREVESVEGKWFSLRIVPYRSEDRIDGVVVTFFDITPQKRVESKIAEAGLRIDVERARLSALMEQMQAAVLIVEAPTGRILSANQRFREIWHGAVRSSDPLDGYGLAGLALQPDGDPLPVDRWPVARAIRDGDVVLDEEITFELPEGKRVTFLVSAAPVSGPENGTDTVVVSMTDITRRVELEEELRVAKNAAEVANQAKTTFLSSLSHELRTPLNAILGYADLLLVMGSFDEAEAQKLERIKIATRHLASLIDQLLAFAVLEEGRGSISISTVDVREVAREAAALAEPEAAAKQLTLVVDLPDEPVEMDTDRDKVRQILVNLLGNAVKYTERGEIRLELRGETERVILAVHDTGVGIAPENWERIFERFSRVGNETTMGRGGVGLGLSVVRPLSRQLGGEVELDSKIGQGTTFTVSLPRRYTAASQ